MAGVDGDSSGVNGSGVGADGGGAPAAGGDDLASRADGGEDERESGGRGFDGLGGAARLHCVTGSAVRASMKRAWHPPQ